MRWKRQRPLWNVVRKQKQGEWFLRAAGAGTLEDVVALLKDDAASTHKRCLAARALGLLGGDAVSTVVCGIQAGANPALDRACDRAVSDRIRHRGAEHEALFRSRAEEAMKEHGISSADHAGRIVQQPGEPMDRRVAAASALGYLRYRPAVPALVSAMAEGHLQLSWACSHSLKRLSSRRYARELISIVRSPASVNARQAAIHALWMSEGRRAGPVMRRMALAGGPDDERTRSMATEALGDTFDERQTQVVLAKCLFDPSIDVRISALCAIPHEGQMIPELREALTAKLDDPDRLGDDRVVAEMAAERLGDPANGRDD